MHINDGTWLSMLCSTQSLQEAERLPLSIATSLGLLIPLPRFRVPPLDMQPRPYMEKIVTEMVAV